MSDQFEWFSDIEQPEVWALTWDDMLRLAQVDPMTRNAVKLAERGSWTREQALIVLAFTFYKQRREHYHAEVKRINETIPDFIMADGKRYDRKVGGDD